MRRRADSIAASMDWNTSSPDFIHWKDPGGDTAGMAQGIPEMRLWQRSRTRWLLLLFVQGMRRHVEVRANIARGGFIRAGQLPVERNHALVPAAPFLIFLFNERW